MCDLYSFCLELPANMRDLYSVCLELPTNICDYVCLELLTDM